MAYSLTGIVRDPDNGKTVVSKVLVRSYRLDTFAPGPTATSANTGVVTLTGLTDGVQYGAYAEYNGKHVNVPLMWVPESLASTAYGTTSQLADVVSSATGENAGTSALVARADHRHQIAAGSIVNADVNNAAAIAYSKLNLASSIVNADVNASAAIAYSKLNLASSIVNADVSGSAAIDVSKLANYANTTWTPVLAGDSTAGVNTYAAQVGNYVRVGPLVIATLYVGLSAKGAGGNAMVGNLYVDLPVTCRNTTNFYPAGAMRGDFITLTAGYTWMNLLVFPNTTRAFLFQNGSGVASATIGPAAVANNTSILGTVVYFA